MFWQRSGLRICRRPGCTHSLLRQHNRLTGQTKHLCINMSVWCRNKWLTFLSVCLSQSFLGPTQPVRHDTDESAGGALHGTAPVCHRRRWRPGRKRNAHKIRVSLLAKYSHCWGKKSVCFWLTTHKTRAIFSAVYCLASKFNQTWCQFPGRLRFCCILPGYDTVQSGMTFRKNILPPFSVFDTDVGLLFRLIVDHCIHVVRGRVCWSMRNGSLWDLGRKIMENSVIRQCVTITVQTLYEVLISSTRVS